MPRHFVYLTLYGSLYHRSFLADKSLKLGSITITDSSIVVSVSKEIPLMEPCGYIGVDVNEKKKITISDTLGDSKRCEEVKDIPDIKERYRAIRAKVAKRTHHDRKVCDSLLNKYGQRERD